MADDHENECTNHKTDCSDCQPSKQAGPSASIIESSALFAGMKQVLISHEGDIYRLRITKNGKLILNK